MYFTAVGGQYGEHTQLLYTSIHKVASRHQKSVGCVTMTLLCHGAAQSACLNQSSFRPPPCIAWWDTTAIGGQCEETSSAFLPALTKLHVDIRGQLNVWSYCSMVKHYLFVPLINMWLLKFPALPACLVLCKEVNPLWWDQELSTGGQAGSPVQRSCWSPKEIPKGC